MSRLCYMVKLLITLCFIDVKHIFNLHKIVLKYQIVTKLL